MNKKILIIGASGYIGGYITEALSNSGNKVFACVRNQKFMDLSPWNSNVIIVNTDLKNKEDIYKLNEIEIDIVIYLVSLDHNESEYDIENTINTNITPLWILIDLLSKNNIKKFIYFSTQQVYGKSLDEGITEKTETEPQNNYGLSHLLCEKIGNQIQRKTGTKFINIRLSNSYGEPVIETPGWLKPVINDFCISAFYKGEIRLLSDGSPLRDFINIKDVFKVVDYFIRTPNELIEHSEYNVGTSKTYSIIEAAIMVSNVFKKKLSKLIPVILPDGKEVRSRILNKTSKKSIYSIKRIQNLGFQPEVSLEQGIDALIDYIKNKKN